MENTKNEEFRIPPKYTTKKKKTFTDYKEKVKKSPFLSNISIMMITMIVIPFLNDLVTYFKSDD